MDRQIIYPGQLLPETTLLQMTKDSMIGAAKLASALLGTSTMASGFAVTPTGPASLQVLCAPGEIYSLTTIDALAFSTLPADTTHTILKQGILLDGVTLSCPAPGTTGQSINYLVQVTYQDADATPVLLPYYNSANPALPYSGMGNNGLTQNTVRKGAAVVAVKAGTSATTGSQTTPAPDAGYVGLYVVTVAFGQTTITSTSISQYASAPLLPAGLVPAVQSSAMTSAQDFGTANTYKANYSPAITTLSNNFVLEFEVLTSNTGASTFSPNGLTAAPIIGSAHSALQGGELVAGGKAEVIWSVTLGSWVLLGCTGGALQVGAATKSQHAVQLSQMAAVVGGSVNAKMSITAASASATFTADEIAVKSALGGASWLLSSFSKNINLGNVGAGGMDTGSSPASGYVAVYVIYNPVSGVSALLGKNATASIQPEVYSGANMPSGYTASALIGVWPTNGSGQFVVGFMQGRQVSIAGLQVLSSSVQQASFVSLSLAAAVPPNAKTAKGYMRVGSSSPANNLGQISSNSVGLDQTVVEGGYTNATSAFSVAMLTLQTLFYTATTSTGTFNSSITITSYTF